MGGCQSDSSGSTAVLEALNKRERSGVNGWAGVFDQHILDGLMEGILLAGFQRRRGWGGWSWFGLRETVLFSKKVLLEIMIS